MITGLDVETHQDSGTISHAASSYPAITGCEHMTFKPVLYANLTTGETDSASGLDITLNVPQFLGVAPSPYQLRTAA